METRSGSDPGVADIAMADPRTLESQLETEKAAERAALAAERAAEAAEVSAKAAKDNALYMLLSVIILALSSIATLVVGLLK